MRRLLGTVRFRLTAWYCLVQLAAFAFFGLLVYGTFRHQLHHHHDGALRRAATQVVEVLGQHADCAHLTEEQTARLDAVARLVLIHEIAGRREVFYESPDAATWFPPYRLTELQVTDSPGFETLAAPPGPARVYTLPYEARSGRRGLVRVMEPLGDVEEPLHTFRLALLFMAPFALLISFSGGYWLAGRSLKPVDHLTRLARDISASNLRERLPESYADDELGRLVRVFNEMIGRLETSFDGITRFTSDAAHELRSPLANMLSTVDVTLGREREPSVYREALGSVREEVERLRSIVDDLLLLARADAGRLSLDREDFPLEQLARDVVDSFEERARELGVELRLGVIREAKVHADERWLRLVVSNLVDNALKFTAARADEGPRAVEISVSTAGARAVLDVADSGPGLPAGEPSSVFERFYRADPARCRVPAGGFGLGLSIASMIVDAHDGNLSASNRRKGGALFTMSLNLAAGPDA